MTVMYVTYAGRTDTPFDRNHWINVHLPLVRECWGPYGLESVSGWFPAGDGGGLIAIAPCVFRDKAAMAAALASPETARIMADVDRVTDIKPQRRRAEALRPAQAELAQVSRLSTMSELAGSIIPELNQSLAAIMMNADACLLWLNRDEPNLMEARASIARLAQDGRRAVDMIKGLRALARRSGLELGDVDINDAIKEVLALLRGDRERGEVVLHVDLSAGDRPV